MSFCFVLKAACALTESPLHSQDGHAQLVELLFCVAKLGRFGRSTGSIGFRIEEKHYSFAEKIGKRDIIASVIFQAKCGGFVANLEHMITNS